MSAITLTNKMAAITLQPNRMGFRPGLIASLIASTMTIKVSGTISQTAAEIRA
jgi:hypothetical protein